MRYLGSVLAMMTLVALAYAGHIDNGATRVYVDAGDAAVTALIGAGDTAGSNYTKAVALGITNAFQAGDAAGSQYVAQVVATNVASDTLRLGGIPASLYQTNIACGVKDPWHESSNVLSYTTSTVTLIRAMGEYIALSLTNNCTLAVDRSTYPSNGSSFVQLSLYIGAFSVTFDTNSISTNSASVWPPGSAGLTLTNNAWNSVILHTPYGATNVPWAIRQ